MLFQDVFPQIARAWSPLVTVYTCAAHASQAVRLFHLLFQTTGFRSSSDIPTTSKFLSLYCALSSLNAVQFSVRRPPICPELTVILEFGETYRAAIDLSLLNAGVVALGTTGEDVELLGDVCKASSTCILPDALCTADSILAGNTKQPGAKIVNRIKLEFIHPGGKV